MSGRNPFAGLTLAAPAPAPSQDAELIALETALAAVAAKLRATDAGETNASWPAFDMLLDNFWRVADQIELTRATSQDGMLAKAKALHCVIQCAGWDANCPTARHTAGLLRDMLNLPEPVAETEAEEEADAPDLSADEEAALDRDDPWHARLGSPPLREQFPSWTRQPSGIQGWLKVAANDFPMLGACEMMQTRDMEMIEAMWRDAADTGRYLLDGLIGLNRRYEAMAKALRGQAMRVNLGWLRVTKGDASDSELWAMRMGDLIEPAGETGASSRPTPPPKG